MRTLPFPRNTCNKSRKTKNTKFYYFIFAVLSLFLGLGLFVCKDQYAPERVTDTVVRHGVHKKFLYIYDLPSNYNYDLLSESKFELLPGTKYSQWQTEFYIHQILKDSKYITVNPSEATIFFVPVYGSGMRLLSNEVRNRIWDNVVTWLRRQKASDNTSFLERRGGMDHAFVFGASRSWCKVSQPLLKSPKCLGLSHQALFDSNFIKLSVEFTGLQQKHLEGKQFIEKLGRIIIVPYMQYDVDSAYNFNFFDKDLPTPKYGKRKNLLYFSGSLLPKTAPFRAIFKEACDSFAGCTFKSSGRRSFNVSAATTSLLESTFCAILGGDTRASKRFFDALHAFCIPVIFDPLLALPFAESIPYNDFVVHASFIRKKEKVVETMEKLRSLPEVEIIRMQTALRSYHNYLSYLSPSIPNAIDMIMWRLYVRGEVLINKSSSKKEFYNISYRDWDVVRDGICARFGVDSCIVDTQTVVI